MFLIEISTLSMIFWTIFSIVEGSFFFSDSVEDDRSSYYSNMLWLLLRKAFYSTSTFHSLTCFGLMMANTSLISITRGEVNKLKTGILRLITPICP